MKKQGVTLLGGSSTELRVDGVLLAETLFALKEGMERVLRFEIEGQSSRSHAPEWLKACTKFEVTQLEAGSAALKLESYELQDSAPDLFKKISQLTLIESENADPPAAAHLKSVTPLDILVEYIASSQINDGEGFKGDVKILESLSRLGGVLGGDYHAIQFDNLQTRSRSFTFTQSDFDKLETLRAQTPPPEGVRVVGTLDSITASKPQVHLKMDGGQTVRVHLEEHDLERIRTLFNTRVVLSGMGHFSPQGKLNHVKAQTIQSARPEDERMFSQTPHPRVAQPISSEKQEVNSTVMDSLFGAWPGEETEEELLRRLGEMG